MKPFEETIYIDSVPVTYQYRDFQKASRISLLEPPIYIFSLLFLPIKIVIMMYLFKMRFIGKNIYIYFFILNNGHTRLYLMNKLSVVFNTSLNSKVMQFYTYIRKSLQVYENRTKKLVEAGITVNPRIMWGCKRESEGEREEVRYRDILA